MYANYKLIKNG